MAVLTSLSHCGSLNVLSPHPQGLSRSQSWNPNLRFSQWPVHQLSRPDAIPAFLEQVPECSSCLYPGFRYERFLYMAALKRGPQRDLQVRSLHHTLCVTPFVDVVMFFREIAHAADQ